jgi:hypothetical protein
MVATVFLFVVMGCVLFVLHFSEMPGFFTLAQNLALSLDEYASLPVPADLAPDGPMDWDVLTDDQLMAIPPHVIMHMNRTAAQGGTQIVSPRQIPSTNIVRRTHQNSSSTFVHLAGSSASRGAAWPVPAGFAAPDISDLEDEPLVKSGIPLASRAPTPVDQVVHIPDRVASPIQRAWIKARAAVDLQARSEVNGDADALARAYERLFGAAEGSLLQDPGLVISASSTFRAMCIITDNSMARQLAPIQARRVVSVAVGPSSVAAFGPNRGFDWNCARVVAEAKFTLAVLNEGHSLIDVSVGGITQVGELLQNPSLRPGCVIAYHPTPGVAWSCAPETFSVYPDLSKSIPRRRIADQVAEELVRGAEFASPLASAAAHKASVDWTRTRMDKFEPAASDVFAGAISWIAEVALSSGTMGRTAATQLRAEVFQAISQSDIVTAAKMTRAVSTVRGVTSVAGRWLKVTGGVVRGLASRLVSMDAHLNAHMNNAAVTRGADPVSWFNRLAKQLPVELRDTSPGTKGWAIIAVHLMLNPPDEKWDGLTGAAVLRTKRKFKATEGIESVDVLLPRADHHSVIRARVDAMLARVSVAYAASYDGAALGSVYCARMADEAGLPKLARLFRANAAAWTFRMRFARCIYTTIGPISAELPANCVMWTSVSENLTNVAPTQVSTRVCPHAPYAWFVQRLKVTLGASNVRMPDILVEGMVSSVVRLAPVIKPDILELGAITAREGHWKYLDATRFACDPDYFADKLESSLDDASRDAREIVRMFDRNMGVIMAADAVAGPGPLPRAAAKPAFVDEDFLDVFARKKATSVKNGYYWLSFLDPDEGDYIQEVLDSAAWSSEFMEAEFPDLETFLADLDTRASGTAYGSAEDALS